MPQFPLQKGTKTTSGARYLDALPVNMMPIPHEANNASSYMRSFHGIKMNYECDGESYSGEYNDVQKSEYRILGSKLYENGKGIASVSYPTLSNMCHSKKSVAYVDGGRVKFYSEGKVSELSNWNEGENYKTYPDWKFTPNFQGKGYLTMAPWISSGPCVINFNIYFDELPDTQGWIIASNKGSSDACGIYFSPGDKAIYYKLNNADDAVFVQNIDAGETLVSVVTDAEFEFPLSVIGSLLQSGDPKNSLRNALISSIDMYDTSESSTFRSYNLIVGEKREGEDRPNTPEQNTVPNEQDQSGATDARLERGMDWGDWHEQAGPTLSPKTEFDLSGAIDIDRHESRFVWITKDKMGCTSLTAGEDVIAEHKPDYIAPFYAQESDPDDNKAIRSWQGKYVAVFGRNTTQWFGLTGNSEQIYSPSKQMQTPAGIVSTCSVCKYKDSFAALGSVKGGTLQVMIISPGSHQKISTATIDNTISKYKERELQGALLESVMINNHDLLFVHLPNETLVFDGNQNAWFQLKSSISGDGEYTGRHIIYNQEMGITIGDKKVGRVGILDDSLSSQYGEHSEFILYTPFVKLNGGNGQLPLFDLSFDTIPGHSNEIQSAFISYTLDGFKFNPNELRVVYNNPREYQSKPWLHSLGSISDSIGFKVRVVSGDPVVLSSFSVRI